MSYGCPHCVCSCCDKFLFAAHPVFGLFYKINVPLAINEESDADVATGAGEDDDGLPSYFGRTMCFRRKLHPRPVIKALTPDSVSRYTAVHLSFGPIEKNIFCFCNPCVREKDWRSRVHRAKATSALSSARQAS